MNVKNECYECTGEMKQEETGMRCKGCGGLYVNEKH